MNSIKKILIIIFLMTLIILNITANISYADESLGETIFDIMGHGFFSTYLSKDSHMAIDIDIGTTPQINEATEFTQNLLGYLQIIGSIISIVALIIIGFRYMFSSLEEKSKMKGVLIYYIVGAILVFATSNFLSIIYKIINGLRL